MPTVRILVAAITIVLWVLLAIVDLTWLAVVHDAVTGRTGSYGEMYGPLSFFRPILFWSAAICSVACAISVMIPRRWG